MKSDEAFAAALQRVRNLAFAAGGGAALLCIVAGWLQPGFFFPAYLVAYLFFLGLSLGCLGIALIHHLTGGEWGQVARRVLEGGYTTLPLMALLFLPLLLGLRTLYLWARPEAVAEDEILQRKTPYLNVPFFEIRALLYFAIWIAIGLAVNWLSSGRDPRGEPRRRRALALLSGPSLILWGLMVTFSAIDWGMSLEPHWFSSVYGVLFMAGQAVTAVAFAILVLLLVREYRIYAGEATAARIHDLGNFLLAFLLFWAYISFTQYLIIWSANLPEETPWYLHRSHGGWKLVVGLLMLLHFFVPFLLLLSRATKRDPRRIAAVASLLLAMRLIGLYWLVMPTFSPGGLFLNWQLLLTLPAIGGLWLGWFAWRFPGRAMIPVYDLPPEEEARHELVRPATS